MGGSSKTTTGYKYYLGMHMVLCHGPIDFLYNIIVDDDEAWKGFNSGGRISISKAGLFGGESSEGGIVGEVDIAMGESTQLQNDYLKSKLGDNVPAYRGVVSAILRKVYLGVNPYLKTWAFRAQRINTKTDGSEQWYKEKAPIGSTGPVSLYIALDISLSMAVVTSNGKTRLENAKVGLEDALAPLLGLDEAGEVDIMAVGYAGAAVTITRYSADGDDVQDIIDWINALDYADVENGTTEFDVAIEQAPAFFATSEATDKISIFLTDGEASGGNGQTEIDAGVIVDSMVETYGDDYTGFGINIDLTDTSDTQYMDTTGSDIPVVDGDDTSAIQEAVASGIYAQFDMNPAHIIKECLTDTGWGMGYQDADMDLDSFIACADTLYDEQMGISLLWSKQVSIEEFITEIIRHINATLYVDRVSGLFTLKLIRSDYVEDDLITLDNSNITKMSNYTRVDPGESVNSVTVVYWDALTYTNASVTADDIAIIQMAGSVVNTTVQYPGFTNATLAARVASRDLTILSSPLLSVTLEANRDAAVLNIGDVFKLEYPDYHTGYVVIRVLDVALGDGKTNRVKITGTEDVFALPEFALTGVETGGWEPIGGDPVVPPFQITHELPYYELVQYLGQTTLDGNLAENEDIGYVGAVASRPENGLNANLWVDSGAGYYESSSLDFSPSAKLGADVDRVETEWTFTDADSLEDVTVNSYAQVGEEYFSILAIDLTLGTMTVGRAILDTLPEPHATGDTLLFWDLFASADTVEYIAGESVEMKVLTNASGGQLALSSGVAGTVDLDSRAVRPYRPANLQANGFLEPAESYYPEYPVVITWVERNRIQETATTFLTWVDDTITPETGTEYVVKVEALNELLEVQGEIITLTQTEITYDVTNTLIGATWAQYPFIRVTVNSLRDGYTSRTGAYITFRGPFREPTNMEAVYLEPIGPTLKLTLAP